MKLTTVSVARPHMKTRQWRPSTAFKKRRGNYLSQVEVTGVAAIFFFFVFVLMSPFLVFEDLPVRARVDLAVSTHGLPQPGVLKEDAIDIAVTERRKRLFL